MECFQIAVRTVETHTTHAYLNTHKNPIRTVGVELSAADVSVAVIRPGGGGVISSVTVSTRLELQHHVVVLVKKSRVRLNTAVRVHGDVDLVQVAHAGGSEAGVVVLIVGVQVQKLLGGDAVQNAGSRDVVSCLEHGHSSGTVIAEVAGSRETLVNSMAGGSGRSTRRFRS